MNDPVLNGAAIGKRPRRRRTWYRRRLRKRRIVVTLVFGTLLAAACWQNVASYFSSPSRHGFQPSSASSWVRGNGHRNPGLLGVAAIKPVKFLARIPGVYPYSVIPGGVKDSSDLRYAALRDYVVRRHYAGFDFNNARLIRSREAREVYLSYRIRDAVFWTRRKIRLQAGELLLTDGKITARARCGNQISDVAKPEVSEEEPAEDVLDQPVAIAAAPAFPGRPLPAPADLPTGVPIAPPLFAGGFTFPYVPFGAPNVSGTCPAGQTDGPSRNCPKHKHPVVPEPSTWLLLASGMALILWRYRRTAAGNCG